MEPVSIYTWVIIPLLIFLARIIDVSLGTIRVILASKGHKKIAPILGFFEVTVWLLAIREILSSLTNPMAYFGYAAGFAFGTYVGIELESKIALGKVMLRITASKDAKELTKQLKKTEYSQTSAYAEGMTGKVRIIHMVLPKKDVKNIIDLLKKYDHKAVYTIEDVRYAYEPMNHEAKKRLFSMGRKAK
ncbi:MAG: DUF5698 domain-containing protein [archaeon]